MQWKRHTTFSLLILVILLAVSGCIGTLYRTRHLKTIEAVRDGFEGMPDNCTKCHFLWAKRFDYYRGWDRYGYLFDSKRIAGFFDPWSCPGIDNMFLTYYATDWWNTSEIDAWPEDIARKAESLSILSRGDGLPVIPASRSEIEGPVIVVAKENRDFTSIQQAINKAEPGTTVFVRPGVYNETIILKDGVTLIGADPVTTIINPLNQGHALRAANHSLVAGFTFTGTGINYATGAFNAAIYAGAVDSTCIITKNIFRENGLFGVWIDGALDEDANTRFDREHGDHKVELHDRPYTSYPNPVIVGNTFYRIGQRGVFCVHARGEVFNNIFLGNVKAVGLERHSRPFLHHNVFFFNNIPMAINRSEPIVCNNIMYHNQWGQRMLRGANPVMFNNVTWESPHFRDFDEAGRPTVYQPHPGTGERNLDPRFTAPLSGDFSFSAVSPLRDEIHGFEAVGIMRDADLPQPVPVACKNSFGREVLAMTDDIVALIGSIDHENEKIRDIHASYRVTYEGCIAMKADRWGDGDAYELNAPDEPAVRIEYDVSQWIMEGSKRYKVYHERRTVNGETTEDSGTIVFNGSHLEARGGRFAGYYNSAPDPLFIGERPFREAPGSFYRDFDQFAMGSIGILGTFYHGYLRIMGGKIEKTRARIDGHECIVVRYPHIGKDQFFIFYLDPAIGYRPRKMEHYYNDTLYRVIDSYQYKAFSGDINLPVSLKVTDYAVAPPDRGAVAAVWTLMVDENSLAVNTGTRELTGR